VNGVHDLGGMDGFGPIEREADEPVFHEAWERRVFALFLPAAFAAKVAVDHFRYAIENMEPAGYLSTSYYEHWQHAHETLLLERGLVTREELAAGHAAGGNEKSEPALGAGDILAVVAKGLSCRSDAAAPPGFRVGDAVRARNLHPRGHTRLPRYVRGRRGRIERDRGGFVFPDAMASGAGEKPQHVYSVRFEARELWGDDATGPDALYIDLFEDYLDPA